MMVFLKLITAITLCLFIFVSLSFAQDAGMTTSPSKREQLGEKRQKVSERVKKRRQEASAAAKVRREAFKAKLAQLRDERKKAIVERVDQRIDALNKKRTDHMVEFLERLSKILDKIEARINKAKASGEDTAAAQALPDAKAAVTNAQAAVEVQAGKSYIIEIPALPAGGTDQTGLRGVVGTAMSSFEKDLRDTKKIVTDAKQAVQKVMSLVKTVKGVDDVE